MFERFHLFSLSVCLSIPCVCPSICLALFCLSVSLSSQHRASDMMKYTIWTLSVLFSGPQTRKMAHLTSWQWNWKMSGFSDSCCCCRNRRLSPPTVARTTAKVGPPRPKPHPRPYVQPSLKNHPPPDSLCPGGFRPTLCLLMRLRTQPCPSLIVTKPSASMPNLP